MLPDGVFEKPPNSPGGNTQITTKRLSQVDTRTEQVRNYVMATNRQEKPETPWLHRVVSILFFLPLASNHKISEDFNSEALPNDHKKLGCIVKLYSVWRHLGKKKSPRTFKFTLRICQRNSDFCHSSAKPCTTQNKFLRFQEYCVWGKWR